MGFHPLAIRYLGVRFVVPNEVRDLAFGTSRKTGVT
jgi:hypothetical protein